VAWSADPPYGALRPHFVLSNCRDRAGPVMLPGRPQADPTVASRFDLRGMLLPDGRLTHAALRAASLLQPNGFYILKPPPS
jgi:hypothetical protein